MTNRNLRSMIEVGCLVDVDGMIMKVLEKKTGRFVATRISWFEEANAKSIPLDPILRTEIKYTHPMTVYRVRSTNIIQPAQFNATETALLTRNYGKCAKGDVITIVEVNAGSNYVNYFCTHFSGQKFWINESLLTKLPPI